MSVFRAVLLGRFCPLHRGHQRCLDSLIGRFGHRQCLVIIGSATSLNGRTPYSLEQRQAMFDALYPNVTVLALPDTEPDQLSYRPESLPLWLQSLRNLANSRGEEFHFYGGSAADISDLAKAFPANVIINRHTEGENISASDIRVRNLWQHPKQMALFVDERLLPIALCPAWQQDQPGAAVRGNV